ncbi:unnamed protein product, partial [Ectocarpus sp. 12 AP-2014]
TSLYSPYAALVFYPCLPTQVLFFPALLLCFANTSLTLPCSSLVFCQHQSYVSLLCSCVLPTPALFVPTLLLYVCPCPPTPALRFPTLLLCFANTSLMFPH